MSTLPATGLASLLEGIAIGRSGNILVSDADSHTVWTMDSSGNNVRVLATDPSLSPQGLAVAPDGSVYFADDMGNVIRRIDAAGNVTIIAGNGSEGFADGPGSTAEFAVPQAVAVDPRGDVIVVEQDNERVRRIDPGGNVTTLAGNQNGDADGTGGPNGTAEFSGLRGVAIDAACNVYVADGNNRIKKITFGK